MGGTVLFHGHDPVMDFDEDMSVQADHGMLPVGPVAALPPVLTPYQINVVPTNDHWGNEYDYSSNGVTYSLQSAGKDGVDGADITLATRFDFNRDIVISDGQFIASPE